MSIFVTDEWQAKLNMIHLVHKKQPWVSALGDVLICTKCRQLKTMPSGMKISERHDALTAWAETHKHQTQQIGGSDGESIL